MPKKSNTPEQIINKLREAEIMLSQGATIVAVSKKIGVTDHTYYRWRKEYGGMRVEQAHRLKELAEWGQVKHGNPGVAYFSETSLTLTRWSGTTWLARDVDNLGVTFVGGISGLLFDEYNNPVLCYTVSRKDTWEDHIRFATWEHGQWSTKLVDLTDGQRNFGLAFDFAGNPAIAYRTSDGKLRLARRGGNMWNKEDVPIKFPFPSQPELVFGGNGNLLIAYFACEGDKGIRVIRRIETGWIIEIIEEGSWAGTLSLSVARNTNGKLGVNILPS